jgi:hypothetical protein
MKNLITILVAAILTVGYSSAVLAAETRRVCVNQIDAKTKKSKQVCKTIKTHKKLVGTPVPTKPAK